MHYLFPEQIHYWPVVGVVTLFLSLSHITTLVINLRKQLIFHAPSLSCFPPEMTLKEQAGEFHTDGMYLPRSGHGHATREINNIK